MPKADSTSDRILIAAWSGPRNISTAMMRSWGNREDTFVCDEPLYAHYLLEHGFDHPGRDEIIQHHDSNLTKVIAWLTGDPPEGKRVFYQKHMSHHLVREVPRDWLSLLTNVFLIREPREMLTSLMQVLPRPTLEDTGLPQQLEIFQRVRAETGKMPAVIDSRDVLLDPERLLGLLCHSVGLSFQQEMLEWPPGRRQTDGVWAKHWYSSVEQSTAFQPYEPKDVAVPQSLLPVLEEAQHYYDELYSHRLR